MSKFLDLEGLGYYTQCFKPGLVDVVDNGTKNLWDFKNLTSAASGGITTSKTDTDITVTSTATWSSIAYPVTLPAGNYVFSTTISNYSKDANVPSGSDVIRIRIATQSGGQGGIGDISITGNGKYSLNFTSTGATLYVLYYPNYNATSYSNTFKASENMICTKAVWNISHAYQPYALSNVELTDFIPKSMSIENYQFSAASVWEYSGLSFTIPHGQTYICTASMNWISGQPESIAICDSSNPANVTAEHILAIATYEGTELCCTGQKSGLAGVGGRTWYVMVKNKSASGKSTIRLTAQRVQ